MTQRRLTLVSTPVRGADIDRARRAILQEGPQQLGDHELVAVCVSSGRRKPPLVRAAGFLEKSGGLARLRSLPVAGMVTHAGMNEHQAIRLSAALELGRRAALDATRPLPDRPLSQSAVEAWAMPRLAGLCHEEVWVLCVNAAGVWQSTFQVGRGGVHGCALLSRDILTPVVRDAASGFVLVHNHPSGDPSPSPEDVELTRTLQRAALCLSIPLLDHVVAARQGCKSFFELGLLHDEL